MAKIIKKQADLIETEVDDELVIVSLVNGEFYSLKGTGLAIWHAIDGSNDREELIAAMAERFNAPSDQIAKDVDNFLTDLVANGFISL